MWVYLLHRPTEHSSLIEHSSVLPISAFLEIGLIEMPNFGGELEEDSLTFFQSLTWWLLFKLGIGFIRLTPIEKFSCIKMTTLENVDGSK